MLDDRIARRPSVEFGDEEQCDGDAEEIDDFAEERPGCCVKLSSASQLNFLVSCAPASIMSCFVGSIKTPVYPFQPQARFFQRIVCCTYPYTITTAPSSLACFGVL